MTSTFEAISMILVGALWGCTNPLLRQGAVATTTTTETTEPSSSSTSSSSRNNPSHHRLQALFRQLLHVRVWLPYVVNQSGSLLYYFTLAQAPLGLAVPICNALALVFSVITSQGLGESMPRPVLTMVGATLVVAGVTLCLLEQQQRQEQDDAASFTDKTTIKSHSTKEEL